MKQLTNSGYLCLLLSLILGHIPSALVSAVEEPPVENTIEAFLRPPKVFNMSLSRDGKYAAGIAPIGEKGARGIVVFDLETMELKKSFHCAGSDVLELRWATNNELVFSLAKWGMFANGLYGISLDERQMRPLVKNDVAISMLDPMPDNPDAWIWIRGGYHIKPFIARINTLGSAANKGLQSTSRLAAVKATTENPLIEERIYQPEGEIHQWYFDHDHEPRVVLRYHDGKLEYLHRYNRDDEWKALPLDAEDWHLELFGERKNILYLSGYKGENTKGLYIYDLEKQEFGQLVFRDPNYDFTDTAQYLYFQRRLIGFRFLKSMPTNVWIVPEMKGIQQVIDATLPNRINVINGYSDDLGKILVVSYSDKTPPEYLVLDLKTKALKEISKSAPWLNYDELSSTQPFRFKGLDGLELEGYLTRPKIGKPPYPTVCLVHGGPWVRDAGGYHDESQFFASKGYAVLKVNYRGSTGYGKAASEDGAYDFKQMHEDVTAAVKLAIRFKVADPERIAIMGASFGGYLALCGAAFEPELYKCAISNMGVFDWGQLIEDRKRQNHKYSYEKLLEELGNPKENEAAFIDISPIHHVENIQIPVFVIHGKEDQNVSVKHSKRLVSELKAHGVPHESLFLGWEGHNIFETEKRVEVYSKILRFLEENL